MTRPLPRVGRALAAALVIAACSTSVETGPRTLAQEEFAGAYADAYCSFGACCAVDGLDPDPSCAEEASAKMQEALEAAHSAGAQYDAMAAAACVAAVRAAAVGCPSSKSGVGWFRKECLGVFTDKSIAPGEPCLSFWDCADAPPATGVCLTSTSAAGSTSQCGLMVLAGEGEACSWSEEVLRQCQRPLLCLADGKCHARSQEGETCQATPADGDDCVDGLVCDRLDSKRCVPAKAIGEACSEIEECELYWCKEGRCQGSGHHLFPMACHEP